MGSLSSKQLEIIRTISIKHGVASVRLFGSSSRGTRLPSSDVDLIVRFSLPATLITFIGLKQALEEALGLSVDVVEEGGLPQHFADSIQAEAVSL